MNTAYKVGVYEHSLGYIPVGIPFYLEDELNTPATFLCHQSCSVLDVTAAVCQSPVVMESLQLENHMDWVSVLTTAAWLHGFSCPHCRKAKCPKRTIISAYQGKGRFDNRLLALLVNSCWWQQKLQKAQRKCAACFLFTLFPCCLKWATLNFFLYAALNECHRLLNIKPLYGFKNFRGAKYILTRKPRLFVRVWSWQMHSWVTVCWSWSLLR